MTGDSTSIQSWARDLVEQFHIDGLILNGDFEPAVTITAYCARNVKFDLGTAEIWANVLAHQLTSDNIILDNDTATAASIATNYARLVSLPPKEKSSD